MIVTSHLPNVVWPSKHVHPLSESWLTETIARSAAAAGYKRWHLASEVARAITVYLENDWKASTALPSNQLRDMICRSLTGIGFDEIAKTAVMVPPRLTLSLVEIAERESYPITFYVLLKQRLAEAVEVQIGGICLMDLRACCRVLAGAKRWTPACELILDEVVGFCRCYLAQVAKGDVDVLIR
jgi:hypothetical protein